MPSWLGGVAVRARERPPSSGIFAPAHERCAASSSLGGDDWSPLLRARGRVAWRACSSRQCDMLDVY
eukprot:4021860-Pyramimonas_sp.AAC.1